VKVGSLLRYFGIESDSAFVVNGARLLAFAIQITCLVAGGGGARRMGSSSFVVLFT